MLVGAARPLRCVAGWESSRTVVPPSYPLQLCKLVGAPRKWKAVHTLLTNPHHFEHLVRMEPGRVKVGVQNSGGTLRLEAQHWQAPVRTLTLHSCVLQCRSRCVWK